MEVVRRAAGPFVSFMGPGSARPLPVAEKTGEGRKAGRLVLP